jgi:hypothetical protein
VLAHFQASDFAVLCEGSRQVREGEFQAKCPAHDDSSPSLNIKNGNKGLLVHCYAGCSVQEVCDAVGVKIQDLFDNQDFVPNHYPPKDKEFDETLVFICEESMRLGRKLTQKDEDAYVKSKLRIAQNEGKHTYGGRLAKD